MSGFGIPASRSPSAETRTGRSTTEAWCIPRWTTWFALDAQAVAWLKGVPGTAVFEGELFLCHGTPASDQIYLLEDVRSGHPTVRSEHEIECLLGDVRYPVVLCGHSHIPRLVRLATGQLIVNPGSVGLPAYDDDSPVPHVMENYSPHASYAILTKRGGKWDVEFRRVAYADAEAAQCAAEAGRPDWASRIATGRAMRP